LERIYEKKKNNKLEKGKGGPFFGNLNYRGKMFAKFCCSLYLSCSSFNFCTFSLNYLYNFSTKLSSALIIETKIIETCL
jgi:hypothetical protein